MTNPPRKILIEGSAAEIRLIQEALEQARLHALLGSLAPEEPHDRPSITLSLGVALTD